MPVQSKECVGFHKIKKEQNTTCPLKTITFEQKPTTETKHTRNKASSSGYWQVIFK